MSPVWLQFGGPGNAMVLGLLSFPEPVHVGGHIFLAVLVTMAPVPVGGGLIFVPVDWVSPAEVGKETLTSIFISMGVTAHQHLGPPRAQTSRATTKMPIVMKASTTLAIRPIAMPSQVVKPTFSARRSSLRARYSPTASPTSGMNSTPTKPMNKPATVPSAAPSSAWRLAPALLTHSSPAA